jgi:hypothetical protein
MADGSSTSSFFEAYPQFDSFVQEVFGRLIEGTKIANTFPADEDHAYFKTFKPFNGKVKDLGNRLLGLTQRFIDLENPSSTLRLRDLAADPEDVSENFDGITTIVDSLVEKVVCFKYSISSAAIQFPSRKPSPNFFFFFSRFGWCALGPLI